MPPWSLSAGHSLSSNITILASPKKPLKNRVPLADCRSMSRHNATFAENFGLSLNSVIGFAFPTSGDQPLLWLAFHPVRIFPWPVGTAQPFGFGGDNVSRFQRHWLAHFIAQLS
jgi:hypothetical protein